tara:strand:+ start:2667 stop:3248 length:582 start_codon:yes stop_codon:yes gene_type:complete
MVNFTLDVSKIAFLFISWAVITSGVVNQVLSCQVQNFFKHSYFGKHIIGFILILMFIMLEGGWSFDKELEGKAPIDWSNGNIFDSSIFAFVFYFVFLLTAKMKLVPNLTFFSLLFLIYIINTQKNYWHNRKVINETTLSLLNNIIRGLLIISGLIFVLGISDYYIYKKAEYKKRFNYLTFIFGSNNNCKTVSD